MAISVLAPSQRSRIAIIDVLRGFALYGIIIAHTGSVYLWELGVEYRQLEPMDAFIKSLVAQFVEKKFYLIFSFLFGLSFFIQLHNSEKKNKPFVLKYIWRLIILFFIGLVHNQLYAFDILQIYAVIALFLLPLRRLTANQLLSTACLLFLGSIFLYQYGEPIEEIVSFWHQGLAQPSQKFVHQLASGNFLAILSLFILGFWAGKTKKFHSSSIDVAFFKRLFLVSLFCVFVIKTIHSLLTAYSPTTWLLNSILLNSSVLNICLSMLYTSLICLLYYYLPQIKPLWNGLENLGRMGLSNYVVQTLFFFIIFRLGIDFTAGGLMLLVTLAHLFFIFQLFYSTVWFRYFKMGPLEWLWRMATNLKWQSNRQPLHTAQPSPSPANIEETALADLQH